MSKTSRRLLLAGSAVTLVLLTALVLGLLNRDPADYRPLQFDPAGQDIAMRAFFSQIQDFGNDAGAGKPFQWKLTDAQANSYLASMDAVAAITDRPVRPLDVMRRHGFDDPAMAMHEGYLTLMVHAIAQDKVISIDLRPEYNDQGQLTMRVSGVRVGVVPVPEAAVEEGRQKLVGQLVTRLSHTDPAGDVKIGNVSLGKMAQVLAGVLDMLNGKYVRPELVWPLGKHHVLVEKIELHEGSLALHVTDAPKPPKASKPPRPSAPAATGP